MLGQSREGDWEGWLRSQLSEKVPLTVLDAFLNLQVGRRVNAEYHNRQIIVASAIGQKQISTSQRHLNNWLLFMTRRNNIVHDDILLTASNLVLLSCPFRSQERFCPCHVWLSDNEDDAIG